ncbi:hypothetical protein HK103_002033 [Boothiomyces macroporosus]|uniref:AB hydrolase-1 domain-containing protein n=1 Tax=Boothiomyces macroporosus TaxID=261099 RepID=A0AAD5U9Q7_9FUNG|nr:hypothetical protein HK103_002033 [Boothiomyces macroporosus]
MDSFNHCYLTIRGLRYHYVDQGKGPFVLLCHGFPDLWYGWRHQIKHLSKQYRVIVPDMVGYGETDQPNSLQEGLDRYTFKSVAGTKGLNFDDLVYLMEAVGAKKFYLVGHDWGGAVAWRLAQYYPDHIISMISLCTPYNPVNKSFIPIDDVVKMLPNFLYQKHLADLKTDKLLDDNVEEFFNWMFGAPNKFAIAKSIFGDVPDSTMAFVPDMSYHKRVYAEKGFHGPLNWYRTRRANWEKEQEGLGPVKSKCLFVIAENDPYLVPAMAKKMKKHVPHCAITSVKAGHWVMIEVPDQISEIITSFFASSKL